MDPLSEDYLDRKEFSFFVSTNKLIIPIILVVIITFLGGIVYFASKSHPHDPVLSALTPAPEMNVLGGSLPTSQSVAGAATVASPYGPQEPSVLPSLTPTVTASASPTPTPTLTPTLTPTATPTVTNTPTPTPTSTPTPTLSETPTASPTATLTPTP